MLESPKQKRFIAGDTVHIPTVVTHYHLQGRRPFLNLSELDDRNLALVLDDLERLRHDGRQYRPFGPRYMSIRRVTEARLRQLFIAAGGRPEPRAPHYFVLGESRWYKGLAEHMETVELSLSTLPPDKTSVTFPDSLTAMSDADDLAMITNPHRGRVYLLNALPQLIADVGLPDPPFEPEHRASWRS